MRISDWSSDVCSSDLGLRKSYEAMFVAYLRTFARLGLQAVPVRAPTGPIGGDLSREFHILADTGASALFYDAAIEAVTDRKSVVEGKSVSVRLNLGGRRIIKKKTLKKKKIK